MIKKLKRGDTIGFFSPSTPITALCPNRFNRSKKFLENKGFKLKAGNLTDKKDFYRSGSIKDRAEELNQLIRDPEVRCIISTIGGMNSNSIVPYIDYESLKKDPKIIIGYSDMTAILFAIYAKTGITTFYGPALVASFGEIEPFNELNFKYFEDILVKEINIPYNYKMPKMWTEEYIDWESQNRSKKSNKNEWITINEGKIKGRLIIGNLNTMAGIWGSEYMPEIKKGDILFIEDSLKGAETIERSFAMLKANNIFDKIGGLILGKHELFEDRGSKRKPYEILEEVIGRYNFPFLAEVDCSHTHPMFTMPIGSIIELDATDKSINLISEYL
ncbi:S66 family peptidase [Senegalia massiliensis]|uniref:S66 family peptidase n=1 Tax=Senegalia massiliensis TaxID=1720316 RepID=UPI001030E041|nr:S66 peptidase family protein [Senegalia massiliensis]